MVNLLNMCDLYVHAADVEIEAISCLEAISCGLVPVISNCRTSATQQFALYPNSLFKSGDAQDCADKIPIIRQNAPENLIIQVDGGINKDTGKICTQLGANSLVAGSYIFNSTDMEEAIKSLKG